MKREGPQRGMVQTYPILPSPLNQRPDTNFVNLLDSPPTAGLFTKVSRKPTNHSKFTGKCGQRKCSGCHLHLACKSKDKVKSTQKLKYCNASYNYRLVTWRDMDSKPGSSMDHVDEEDDYMDHDGDGVDEDSVNESVDVEIKNGEDNVHDDDDNNHGDGNIDDDDDNNNHNNTSYCDMGLWWEQVEGDKG